MNIMISDPDVFTREGIKHILESEADLNVVRESSSVDDTLDGLRDVRLDVCILGISMDNHCGLRFVRDARKHAQHVPLLVLSHYHERDFALRAIRAGAAGYLPKDCTEQQLCYAVRTAAQRRPYVSETMCELLVESIVDVRSKRLHDSLSDIDLEIFCLTAEGIPVAKIAALCKTSPAVIRARKGRIMKKMCLQTDAELIEYAIKRKLIEHSFRCI